MLELMGSKFDLQQNLGVVSWLHVIQIYCF
jgi:hypothetical protein